MYDHDDEVRQLARYGSGVARLYLWAWICVCYVWVVLGVIGGVLVMNDGSTVFGAGMIVLGLIALKVAGHLKRLKNGNG